MAVPAWVTEVGVAGTWVIGIAAIWGERIRARLFRPSLEVELLRPAGELVDLTVPAGQPAQRARFYHLRIRNPQRFPAAHEVQAVVTKVDKPGPDGRPLTIFAGLLPLGWRHAEIHPTALVVGPERHADFLFATDKGMLQFTPMLIPNNFPIVHKGATKLWVSVVARALEYDTEPIIFEISWDGQWAAGETEMAQHLVIKKITS